MNNLNLVKKKSNYLNIKGISTSKIVKIAMFGALSTILMYLDFPLPLSPAFAKMDFSDLPIILGGFIMGPMAVFFIILLKIVLILVLKGTSTMGVGELANMLGSTSYMLPTVLLYRRLKTRNGAILSLSTGMIITCICATLSNLYLVFPIYCKLYGMSMDNLVAMGTAVNPLVRDMRTFVVFSMLPGNLIKYFLISIVTFIAYKRINKINIWMEERV